MTKWDSKAETNERRVSGTAQKHHVDELGYPASLGSEGCCQGSDRTTAAIDAAVAKIMAMAACEQQQWGYSETFS